jgi:hypothetical protein
LVAAFFAPPEDFFAAFLAVVFLAVVFAAVFAVVLAAVLAPVFFAAVLRAPPVADLAAVDLRAVVP